MQIMDDHIVDIFLNEWIEYKYFITCIFYLSILHIVKREPEIERERERKKIGLSVVSRSLSQIYVNQCGWAAKDLPIENKR